MNQVNANKAILQAWLNNWPGLSTNVPYVFDNDAISGNPPKYARVAIQDLSSEQTSLGAPGSRRYLRTGLINVKLYGPVEQGRKVVDLLAQFVRTIFEGVRLAAGGTEEGVVTFASSTQVMPTDQQFWILLVSTPFEYYEIR